MREKNKTVFSLKLMLALVAGLSFWKCSLHCLNVLMQKFNIGSLWAVVLSRFALIGYLLPFAAWFFLEPHKVYGFCAGEIQAAIKMPGIWYGIKDNVLRVSSVFSMLCLAFAIVLFCAKQLSASVILAGFTFAIVNSILEELLWRGLILSRTIQLYGEKLGLLLMSLAFGLYHYPFGFSIPICILFSFGGIYFGGIAICSKGLLLGTVMHICMNILFVAIGIIF